MGNLTDYVATLQVTYIHESQRCQLWPILPNERKSKVKVKPPRFQTSRQIKAVRLSTLRTGRLYPPENTPGTHFCYRLSATPGPQWDRKDFMSTKNFKCTIENRTRDLPGCSLTVCPERNSNFISYAYPRISLISAMQILKYFHETRYELHVEKPRHDTCENCYLSWKWHWLLLKSWEMALNFFFPGIFLRGIKKTNMYGANVNLLSDCRLIKILNGLQETEKREIG